MRLQLPECTAAGWRLALLYREGGLRPPTCTAGRNRSRDYNARHAASQAHALGRAQEVDCPWGRGRHEPGAGPQRGEAQPVPEILPGCPALSHGAAVLGDRADHMGHHLPDTPGPMGRAGRLPVLHHPTGHPLMAPGVLRGHPGGALQLGPGGVKSLPLLLELPFLAGGAGPPCTQFCPVIPPGLCPPLQENQ
ncbi:gamma-secretase subunit PEN-2 isoform X1 [Chelonia mydas]|uniref:gamma-secretase subunit PEN-2 isoform X1 n=1 Tax=Chelonia mydas TaxID=8469 RepID=UPI001CA88D2C|nr:gamma-secretase subunit PEN-2 isoform X1 [Chelonia mydas]